MTTFDEDFNNYLENCNVDRKKCAIVATDKQCVMLLEDKNSEENNSHNGLAIVLENMIHPDDQRIGWAAYRASNAYVFLEGPELIANLPLDGTLSTNQAVFLLDILKKVCEFNYENNDLISIDIVTSNDYRQYHSHNLKSISKCIIPLITSEYIIEDEKIIGKTLADNHNSPDEAIKVYQKSYKTEENY